MKISRRPLHAPVFSHIFNSNIFPPRNEKKHNRRPTHSPPPQPPQKFPQIGFQFLARLALYGHAGDLFSRERSDYPRFLAQKAGKERERGGGERETRNCKVHIIGASSRLTRRKTIIAAAPGPSLTSRRSSLHFVDKAVGEG